MQATRLCGCLVIALVLVPCFVPGARRLVAVDFIRGDANGDGVVSLADGETILAHVFRGAEPPSCLNAADVDDSGRVDGEDARTLIADIFGFGASGLNLRRRQLYRLLQRTGISLREERRRGRPPAAP